MTAKARMTKTQAEYMRKSILILLLFATACTGPMGPVGPDGEQGVPGDVGVPGDAGDVSGVITGMFSGVFNIDGESIVWIPRVWTADHKAVIVQLLVESPGAQHDGNPIDIIVNTGTNEYVHLVTTGVDPVKGVFVFITGYSGQRWWLSVVVVASQGGDSLT